MVDDFKSYRLEYGIGKDPIEWLPIATGYDQKTNDVKASDIDDSSDMTIYGNLGNWDTGLKNYVYGDEYATDHPIDLNGVYTIRLVVSNSKGELVEDRVTLEVGSVIPVIYGGIVPSVDGTALLTVQEQSIKDSFRVFSIKPVDEKTIPSASQQPPFVDLYEFRPAGERFTKAATLAIHIKEGIVNPDNLGRYAYNVVAEKWEYFPTIFDKTENKLITHLQGFPDKQAYFAVIEKGAIGNEVIVSDLWIEEPTKNVKVAESTGEYLVNNTFENGLSGWSNRVGVIGATVSINDQVCKDGHCVQLTNTNLMGNFASTIIDRPFNAKNYPVVRFDYKIPSDVKINVLAKLDERWYDIEFSDDPKQYRRVNMERIGRIEDVQADDKWHTAEFNLYEMLSNHPPLKGRDAFIVQEIVMADWDVEGYMKLVYGRNKKGATYYVDNFAIAKEAIYAKHKGSDMPLLASNEPLNIGASSSVGRKATGTANTEFERRKKAKGSLVIEDFRTQKNTNGLEKGGVFTREGKGKIITTTASDDKNNTFLMIDYDVRNTSDYAGYFRTLEGTNLSQYNTLSFWVRGVEGKEAVRVGLKNSTGEETKIVLNYYLKNGITQTWQKVSIPLKAFSALKNNSSMDNLSFLFEEALGSRNGRIFIADISLEKEMSLLPVANCLDGTGHNIWGSSNETFKTSEAQLDVRYDASGCLISYSGIISQKDAESWAGWRIYLNDIDVTNYNTLTLKIKRVTGNERPNIYLTDGAKGVKYQFVNIEKYIKKDVDGEEVAVIPLKEFKELGVNLTHLKELVFMFEWEQMAGVLYVNDILFSGDWNTNGKGSLPVGLAALQEAQSHIEALHKVISLNWIQVRNPFHLDS